jgi:hypothetical protein
MKQKINVWEKFPPVFGTLVQLLNEHLAPAGDGNFIWVRRLGSFGGTLHTANKK